MWSHLYHIHIHSNSLTRTKRKKETKTGHKGEEGLTRRQEGGRKGSCGNNVQRDFKFGTNVALVFSFVLIFLCVYERKRERDVCMCMDMMCMCMTCVRVYVCTVA